MKQRIQVVRPGFFSVYAPADSRRDEFDIKNEVLMHHNIPIDFVFIGDSITHYWDLSAYFVRRGIFAVNRGIGADTSTNILRRFEADVLQLQPKHVVILAGHNNTAGLDAVKPVNRKSKDDLRQEIVMDIRRMVQMSLQKQIIPIVCSLLPNCVEIHKNMELRNELIRETNEDLKLLCQEMKVIYIDYYTPMAEDEYKKMRAELVDDGVHPNVLGYDIMEAALRKELKANGIQV